MRVSGTEADAELGADVPRVERTLPRWLLWSWILPTLSWSSDLLLRGSTLADWTAERWGLYALTACWGYLGWALAALIGLRLTQRSRSLGSAWFGLQSGLLAASLACTWGYYWEAGQYPTWSEVMFLIEEASNAQATFGLVQGSLSGATVVALCVFALSFGLWRKVMSFAGAGVSVRRGTLAALLTLCCGLWVWRGASRSMADAAPLLENGPVVASMALNYYSTRDRGVFHEAERHPVGALSPSESAPNIILVIHESLGRKALSLYGNRERTTPRLERRVAEEPESWFVFPRALTNSSNTSVSVPTILLGVEPGSSVEDFHLAPALWHYARAAGYRTALLSAQSWKYATLDRFLLSDPPDHVWTAEPEQGISLVNGGGMDDVEFFPQIEAQLARDAGGAQRFLHIVQFNATHHPFLPRPGSGFDPSTRISRYHGAVELLDELTERLLQSLERNGLADNTVLLFTSDHGENHGEHVVHRTQSFYEEVLGIPFIMRVPERVRQQRPQQYGLLRSQLGVRAQNLDVVPTLLDVMGVYDAEPLAPLRAILDGQSLLTPIDPNRINIHRNVVPIRIWSNEGFGLTRGDERYSFTEWRGDEWYDLARDPGQLHDLAPGLERLPEWVRGAIEKAPALAMLRAEHCAHLKRCLPH